MTSIAPHIEAFLREHLARHRGASEHTCDSYAYSFQSLFKFASQKLKVPPSALMLEQFGCATRLHFSGASGDDTSELSGNTKHPIGGDPVIFPLSAAS